MFNTHQTVETTNQAWLEYEKKHRDPFIPFRSPKSTTSPRGPVQFVELRGASAHICGLTECYVESIQEVRGGGGGVDFQGTFAKKTCGRRFFFLGGWRQKNCIGSFGVAGYKLRWISFFEEVFFSKAAEIFMVKYFVRNAEMAGVPQKISSWGVIHCIFGKSISPKFIEWIPRMMSLRKCIYLPLLKQCRLHRFQKQSKNSRQKDFQFDRQRFFLRISQDYLMANQPLPPNVPPVRNTGLIVGLINDTNFSRSQLEITRSQNLELRLGGYKWLITMVI